MKTFKMRRGCTLLAVLVLAGTYAGAASANMLVQPQVSGQVSGMNGATAVTINGHTYLINSSSPAYLQIQGVHLGDQIGLVLNGPVNSSSTEVVGIVTGNSSKSTPGSH